MLLGCRAMQRLLAPQLSLLPDPCLEPQPWEALWAAANGTWAGLLRRLRERVVLAPSRAAEIMEDVPELGPPRGLVCDSDSPDEFLCGVCDRWFPSAVAATSHRMKVHGGSFAARVLERCGCGSCPFCGTDFHSRDRLVHHFRCHRGCRASFEASDLPLLDPGTLEAARLQDVALRQAARAVGRSVLSGLPAKLAK